MPNVRTGPAFAADQVAPNSYLQMILVILVPILPPPLHLHLLRTMSLNTPVMTLDDERRRSIIRRRKGLHVVVLVLVPVNVPHGKSQSRLRLKDGQSCGRR